MNSSSTPSETEQLHLSSEFHDFGCSFHSVVFSKFEPNRGQKILNDIQDKTNGKGMFLDYTKNVNEGDREQIWKAYVLINPG